MPKVATNQLAPIIALLPQVIGRLPGPVRYRAENALEGFSRARMLLPIDREIASFRAITAAEEAASALIRSLQVREYPKANLIDLRKHSHKAAVPFFLRAVRHTLAGNGTIEMTMTLSVDPPKLTVALPLHQFISLPEKMKNAHLELVDPLGIVGSNAGVEAAEFFDEAVRKVAGSRKVDKLIARDANSRNRVLYAHDSGRPRSQATLESLEKRESDGILCLMLAVAVMQVQHHQGFALQCLNGFLKVVGRADSGAS